MTALPATLAWTDASVTEGGFKAAQSDLRDYLAGLLGADGVAATARAALSVPPIASPTLTTQLNVAAINNATVRIYSDAASESVIETTNDATPATKYITHINKYGGTVKVGGSGGLTVVDGSGICLGVNDAAPSGTARLSVIETTARYSASLSGQSVGMLALGASESFADAVMSAYCHRAANTAYNFFAAVSDSNGTPDVEFALRGDGNAFADGSFTGSGADYQEYFKSQDGSALAVGECVVLDGDTVRVATAQDAPEAIMGVVRPKEDNKNSAVVGNAAWNHWSEKYLTDDYGRYVLENYKVWDWDEHIPAVMAPQRRQKVVTRTVTRPQVVVEAGRAVVKPVTQPVTEAEYTEHPLFDAQGRAVYEEKPVIGADGMVVMTDQQVTDDSGAPLLIDGVPAVRKHAVMQRSQAVHHEPVMETVQVEVSPARTVHHTVAEGKIPDGVTVPADAKVTVYQRRKLNPAFRDSADYTTRHDRPEWNLIGLLGQVQIREGAPVNPRWVRMKAVSDAVGLWFVR